MGISRGRGEGVNHRASEGNPRLERELSDALLCSRDEKQATELHNFEKVEAFLFELFNERKTGVADRNPFSRGTICHIHSLVVEGLYSCGGRIRENDALDRVKIDANFVPATPADVRLRLPDLLDRCTGYCFKGNRSEPPVTFAARAFHEFQTIHPFRGGNGRVGRALLNMILIACDEIVPPMSLFRYCRDYRNLYFHALRSADAGNYGALEAFVQRGVIETRVDQIRRTLEQVTSIPQLGGRIARVLKSNRTLLLPEQRVHLEEQEFYRSFNRFVRDMDRAVSPFVTES